MGKLKRNTVAFERAVEYTGNIQKLSCDARFAISNMTAEFGGIAGIFEADDVTAAFIAKRTDIKSKSQSKVNFFFSDYKNKFDNNNNLKKKNSISVQILMLNMQQNMNLI